MSSSISLPMIRTMLSLQSTMNTEVNPNWITAEYPFLRAAMIEGAEAMDHLGWKWWKKQEENIPQYKIELIDIWHFALSAVLVENNGDIEETGKEIIAKLSSTYQREGISFGSVFHQFDKLDTLDRIQLLIGLASANHFSYPLFETLMVDVRMGWEEFFKQFVGKNTLNLLRQANGYKEGNYIKMWNGKEDNVYLEEVMELIDCASPTFADDLYRTLSDVYAQVYAPKDIVHG